MLRVGDKVRYSNEYLAKHNLIAPGHRRGRHWSKIRRGKQKIMTVLQVIKGEWDWKTKKYTGDLVILDDNHRGGTMWSGYPINTHWLRFVRRDT